MAPRSGDTTMWAQLFELDSEGPGSLQQQIRESLVHAILDGRIGSEVPLPSSRRLAGELGVARNTVILAYQHLADEGYLIARERSGYFVNTEMLCNRAAVPSGPEAVGGGAEVNWKRRFRIRPSTQRNITKPVDWQEFTYPFIYGQMDPRHFPANDWRECYRMALTVPVLSSTVRDHMDADNTLLMEQIQSRVLTRRGIWISPDEIIGTMGSQNALYLLATLLVGRDTVVGVEDPGYPDTRNIMALRTRHVRPLPVDEGGVVVDERLDECDYVIVTPSHQSPTTVTMPLERRQALLKRAQEKDFLIIEDDYESEINFLGSPTPALKSLDKCDRVLYVGSLSKILDPGLRVGYLVGPAELIREARALRRLMFRHPPANNQHATALFLSLGHYDSLIQRLSHVYKARWEAMRDALARHIPDSATTPSFGGSAFWVEGPAELDARALSEVAAEEGVLFEPGDVNFFEPQRSHCFRLGFSSIAEERIEPGIECLARLMHAMVD